MKHCFNCKQEFDPDQYDNWFKLWIADWDIEEYLCSPSCLVERAWWFKQEQEKLSKSKTEA